MLEIAASGAFWLVRVAVEAIVWCLVVWALQQLARWVERQRWVRIEHRRRQASLPRQVAPPLHEQTDDERRYGTYVARYIRRR